MTKKEEFYRSACIAAMQGLITSQYDKTMTSKMIIEKAITIGTDFVDQYYEDCVFEEETE